MNHLGVTFGLIEMAFGGSAFVFVILGFLDNRSTRERKTVLSPASIWSYVLLSAGMVARLAYLLLRQQQDSLDLIQIAVLFVAVEVSLMMVAVHYQRSFRRLQILSGQ